MMMILALLTVLLVLATCSTAPFWGHSRSWGYGPSGRAGVLQRRWEDALGAVEHLVRGRRTQQPGSPQAHPLTARERPSVGCPSATMRVHRQSGGERRATQGYVRARIASTDRATSVPVMARSTTGSMCPRRTWSGSVISQ